MSGANEERSWSVTPARIALVYAVLSGLWILLSDRLVVAIAANTAMETWLQTAKGLVFIVLSAGVIYELARQNQAELRATNRRLKHSVQQMSVLHRVLRHNLRNACNVIDLNTHTLGEQAADSGEHERRILQRTQTLVTLSEKARHLRKLLFEEGKDRWQLDAVGIVEQGVAEFAAAHQNAEIS